MPEQSQTNRPGPQQLSPQSNQNNRTWAAVSHDIAARSRHPGGVHAVLVDGHVSFISDAIDATMWRALGSRNGNEFPDSF
jgi:prepilin-type processing-associated H-X9-DG protein